MVSTSRSLRGRDLLSVADLDRPEVDSLFERAAALKDESRSGHRHRSLALAGRTVALLFEKPSLRTRVTFEAGIAQLGGSAIHLAPTEVGLGRRESVADVARNLDRWVDAIVARTFEQRVVEELAAAASIPVINALTDREHPCQALADLFTLWERLGRLDGLVVAFVGDGDNVYHSLVLLGAMLGLEVRLAHPPGYAPDPAVIARAQALASSTGGRVVVGQDPRAMARGADVVYTDVWTSMGREAEADERRRVFAPYRVDASLLEAAGPTTLVMHCLPAHRGEEITDEVLDGPCSLVLEQAENRLHVQKAFLVEAIGEEESRER